MPAKELNLNFLWQREQQLKLKHKNYLINHKQIKNIAK